MFFRSFLSSVNRFSILPMILLTELYLFIEKSLHIRVKVSRRNLLAK